MAVYTQIDNPELFFQCKLYTGTGSSHAITLGGSEDMSPNLVWSKSRSNGSSHTLCDAVRGVTEDLYSESTAAEYTNSTGLTAFGSDGFTVGSDNGWNGSSRTFVAWCWKESATAGFDIVAYTGTGSAKTEAHSLSAVPHLMIIKNRETGSESWLVYHASQGNGKALKLDTNAAVGTNTAFWNDTTPTSSVFTIGTDGASNENTKAHIAYLWSEKQGFSKFGSYVANNNANGPFVYTGFRPAYLMVKSYLNAQDWEIFDNKRSTFNPIEKNMAANTANAEYTDLDIDFLSNGFKVRITDDSVNNSSYSYIYMAFAEAPFVNSNGVPCNAR